MTIANQQQFIQSLGLDPSVNQQSNPNGLLGSAIQPGQGEWSYWNQQGLSNDQTQYLRNNPFDSQNFRLSSEDADQWRTNPAYQQILQQTGGQVNWDPVYGSYIPISAQNQWNKQFNNNGLWDTLGEGIAGGMPAMLGGAVLSGGLLGMGPFAGGSTLGGPAFDMSSLFGGTSLGGGGSGLGSGGGGGNGMFDFLDNWDSSVMGDPSAFGLNSGGGDFNSWFNDLIGVPGGGAGPTGSYSFDQFANSSPWSSFSDFLKNPLIPGTNATGGNLLGGLANYLIKNQQAGKLTDAANNAANMSNSLAQPQRQPYQQMFQSLMTNPNSYQMTPYAQGMTNMANQAFQANVSKYGPGGTQFSDYLKNYQNILSGDFFNYANALSGAGGFGFAPSSGAAYSNLAGQAANAGMGAYEGFGSLFSNPNPLGKSPFEVKSNPAGGGVSLNSF